jgi:hypothetical protein
LTVKASRTQMSMVEGQVGVVLIRNHLGVFRARVFITRVCTETWAVVRDSKFGAPERARKIHLFQGRHLGYCFCQCRDQRVHQAGVWNVTVIREIGLSVNVNYVVYVALSGWRVVLHWIVLSRKVPSACGSHHAECDVQTPKKRSFWRRDIGLVS